jgi:hypothetical protein
MAFGNAPSHQTHHFYPNRLEQQLTIAPATPRPPGWQTLLQIRVGAYVLEYTKHGVYVLIPYPNLLQHLMASTSTDYEAKLSCPLSLNMAVHNIPEAKLQAQSPTLVLLYPGGDCLALASTSYSMASTSTSYSMASRTSSPPALHLIQPCEYR